MHAITAKPSGNVKICMKFYINIFVALNKKIVSAFFSLLLGHFHKQDIQYYIINIEWSFFVDLAQFV